LGEFLFLIFSFDRGCIMGKNMDIF
jgi:hypothetical protein